MKKIMFNDKFLLTQAVLNGTKTMTRRLLKVPKTCNGKEVYSFNILTNNAGTQCVDLVDENEVVLGSWKPHYEVGEVVAIAQSYKAIYDELEVKGNWVANEWWCDAWDVVGGNLDTSAGYTNKMFVKADLMPHHIIITDVKVERLQDITNEDCLKEGIFKVYDTNVYGIVGKNLTSWINPKDVYAYLIDKISGKGTWQSNPFVWVYDFELVK